MAVSLAEGQSVRDMAEATGHAIYWHLTHIYMKRVISRQADRAFLALVDLRAAAETTRDAFDGGSARGSTEADY